MRRFHLPKAAKIALFSVIGIGLAFVALMGFAHTKAGRPLLALMGRHGVMKGKCPLGYDVAQTPEQKEAARQRFAAVHHGDTRAVARPALGFVLDRTTRDDVLAWAKAHAVSCTIPKSGADLDCSNVPDALLPDADRGAFVRNLWLYFGEKDTLISVIAVRRDKSAEAISRTFGNVSVDLSKEAGPPATVDGDASASRLSSGLLQQASIEYRFRNYYALARATNMGDGYVLTEEYRSLPD